MQLWIKADICRCLARPVHANNGVIRRIGLCETMPSPRKCAAEATTRSHQYVASYRVIGRGTGGIRAGNPPHSCRCASQCAVLNLCTTCAERVCHAAATAAAGGGSGGTANVSRYALALLISLRFLLPPHFSSAAMSSATCTGAQQQHHELVRTSAFLSMQCNAMQCHRVGPNVQPAKASQRAGGTHALAAVAGCDSGR